MKRKHLILMPALLVIALVTLAQTNMVPTRWLPHGAFSYVDDLTYRANIDREAVVSSPSWDPTKPLPLGFAAAERIARSELRKIVSDESSWEVTQFQIWRLRRTAPPNWYYEVRLSPSIKRREYSTNSLPDDFAVLIDFNGRPGQITKRPAE